MQYKEAYPSILMQLQTFQRPSTTNNNPFHLLTPSSTSSENNMTPPDTTLGSTQNAPLTPNLETSQEPGRAWVNDTSLASLTEIISQNNYN